MQKRQGGGVQEIRAGRIAPNRVEGTEGGLVDNLRTALTSRQATLLTEWQVRPAAVLVPFYEHDGQWHLLFTERTHEVEEHKGQVAFPGGGRDPGDSSTVETALREAEEEIGLQRADVAVVGQLDELLTLSRWRVTPVVGVIPHPYDFAVNPRECTCVFGVPLRWLTDPANLEGRRRPSPTDGSELEVYCYREYEGHLLWGVTARIVRMLLDALSQAARPGVHFGPGPCVGPRLESLLTELCL